MADVTIEPARLCDTWNEMRSLCELHWREIATHLDVPLAPMLDQYEAVEKAGKLRLFVVRDGGLLVGYALYVVAPHPHYASQMVATQDVIYLHPDHRRGGLGSLLIRRCDEWLSADGVSLVVHHVKVAHPALGVLLGRQGYAFTERLYSKRLDTPKE